MSIQKNVESMALKYKDNVNLYSPFPNCDDRLFWDNIDNSLKKKLIDEGQNILDTPYPTILASDYMNFTYTGNRIDYENKYFERRHILNKLVLAECADNSGKYLNKIIDGIWLLCEESSWVLPAHNTYIRDTPQIILPDVSRPVLDLFACETAALLSMVNYLLRKKLDTISPIICERIEKELLHRIIEPYISQHFWWMGNEEEPMCNWTPWCTQNILLTAFLSNNLNLSSEIMLKILQKSAYSVDCFLKDYGEDGCCDEGAQYFRHAGLCLFGCLDIMNSATNNHFISLFSDEKIKNIASYIYNMHVSGPYYYNFADCAPIIGKSGAREYLFGKATNQEKIMEYAANDYVCAYNDDTLLLDESLALNLYYRTQTIYSFGEITSYNSSHTCNALANDSDLYYKSVGIWITQNESFNIAVKSGNNDDSHNHNDTGSFIIYKNGSPIFVDIGVETYTKKTFSKDRYDIWTMQSCYHNLPTIDGIDQSAGEKYCASDIQITSDKNSSSFEMNISTAYDNLNHPYIRRLKVNKADSKITIEDNTTSKDVILNFITYHKPSVSSNENANSFTVSDASISFSGASLIEVETLPITDERLKKAWDHDLYRIRMKLNESTFLMEIV